MAENNLWIISLAMVAIIAIVAVLGMIKITGALITQEESTYIDTSLTPGVELPKIYACIYKATQSHQDCIDKWQNCKNNEGIVCTANPQGCSEELQRNIVKCTSYIMDKTNACGHIQNIKCGTGEIELLKCENAKWIAYEQCKIHTYKNDNIKKITPYEFCVEGCINANLNRVGETTVLDCKGICGYIPSNVV